jgi:hypothetical protein
MTRRGLLAALAACALDPERLLWRPGAKLISIPKDEFRRNYIEPALAAMLKKIRERYAASDLAWQNICEERRQEYFSEATWPKPARYL